MEKNDDCGKKECMQYTTTTATIISCMIIILAVCYTSYNWEFLRALIMDLRNLVDAVNIIIPGIHVTIDELKTMCKQNMTRQYTQLLERVQVAQMAQMGARL